MTKTNVPIEYGLIRFNEWGNALMAASSNNFPNAEEDVLGGCIVANAKEAIIYVCPQCQLARRRWLSEHPAPRKYTEESVAGEWVGFETSWQAEIFKLNLMPNGTGFLTEAPHDATNEASIYQYKISKWFVATNDLLECYFSQRHSGDPLRLTGIITGQEATSLKANLNNGEGGWKQDVLFWRAKDLDEKMKSLRQ